MKVKRLFMASIATLMFLLPWGAAQAFECPKHFTEAQAVINKVTEDTTLVATPLCMGLLVIHIVAGVTAAYIGAKRHHW